MLFKSLFLPVMIRIQEPSDKKLIIYGVSELLAELQGLIRGSVDSQSLWFAVLGEILKLSASKESGTSEFSSADVLDDISTSQGSFNRLSSIPKFRKYSKLLSFPESDLRVWQLIKSLEQVPTFKEQIPARLDEPAKIQLNFLLRKYNSSL